MMKTKNNVTELSGGIMTIGNDILDTLDALNVLLNKAFSKGAKEFIVLEIVKEYLDCENLTLNDMYRRFYELDIDEQELIIELIEVIKYWRANNENN